MSAETERYLSRQRTQFNGLVSAHENASNAEAEAVDAAAKKREIESKLIGELEALERASGVGVLIQGGDAYYLLYDEDGERQPRLCKTRWKWTSDVRLPSLGPIPEAQDEPVAARPLSLDSNDDVDF